CCPFAAFLLALRFRLCACKRGSRAPPSPVLRARGGGGPWAKLQQALGRPGPGFLPCAAKPLAGGDVSERLRERDRGGQNNAGTQPAEGLVAAFLGNLRNVVIAGFVLAILLAVLYAGMGGTLDDMFWAFVVRWLHIASGVMWIGLLWYFNFVSTPTTPKIPEEFRPALGRFITPAALWWFRWSAMSTII